jgi:hypothetical protein
MYIKEYICFNKRIKLAVRGVLMYREKRDLSEKRRGKVLAIYTAHRILPKKSQRKNIWRKLWCGKETRYIHVEMTGYYVSDDSVKFIKSDVNHVFGYQVRSFRRRLKKEDGKHMFDRFYYEKQ